MVAVAAVAEGSLVVGKPSLPGAVEAMLAEKSYFEETRHAATNSGTWGCRTVGR